MTKRERRYGADYTRQAMIALATAEITQAAYYARLKQAMDEHGDIPYGYSYISGVYAEHFPEQTKTELRVLAHAIHPWKDTAIALWRKAGRRIDTLRPYLRDGVPA